ncbi:MAG TPA: signal peptidase II [Gemmataceae bacterium]|nr:signal peptidase II [Gemmataceae bacterium]
MTERSYRGLFWALALLGALADVGTKYAVFAALQGQANADSHYRGEHTVIPGAFAIEAHYARDGDGVRPEVNQGALFGAGRQFEGDSNRFFAVISVLAAGAIVFWSTRRATARDWALSAALGLILAGTLGNLYDRLVFDGVRDFIHVHYRPHFDWPVFNLADCCLVGGAFLLLAQAFWGRSAATEPTPAAAPPAAEPAPSAGFVHGTPAETAIHEQRPVAG